MGIAGSRSPERLPLLDAEERRQGNAPAAPLLDGEDLPDRQEKSMTIAQAPTGPRTSVDISSALVVAISAAVLVFEGWSSGGETAGTCGADYDSSSTGWLRTSPCVPKADESVQDLPAAPLLLKWALLALTAATLFLARHQLAVSARAAEALADELRMLQDEYEAQEAKLASVATQLDESESSYDALINLLTFRPQGENSVEAGSGPSREAEIVPPPATPIPAEVDGQPDATLAHALRERRLDWSAAIRAATRIRDLDYTLPLFYADCRLAFPELCLYTCERQSEMTGQVEVSSGVSGNDEYKRTIGALFAVYW